MLLVFHVFSDSMAQLFLGDSGGVDIVDLYSSVHKAEPQDVGWVWGSSMDSKAEDLHMWAVGHYLHVWKGGHDLLVLEGGHDLQVWGGVGGGAFWVGGNDHHAFGVGSYCCWRW